MVVLPWQQKLKIFPREVAPFLSISLWKVVKNRVQSSELISVDSKLKESPETSYKPL